METWIVTYLFSRGFSVTEVYKSQEAAKEAIDIIVWKNRDCINFNCYCKSR